MEPSQAVTNCGGTEYKKAVHQCTIRIFLEAERKVCGVGQENEEVTDVGVG